MLSQLHVARDSRQPEVIRGTSAVTVSSPTTIAEIACSVTPFSMQTLINNYAM